MEILLWTTLIILVSKTILKAIRPDLNRALDKKIKEYYKNLKINYELFNFTNNILEYFSKSIK